MELSLKSLDVPGLLVHELVEGKDGEGGSGGGHERGQAKLRYTLTILDTFKNFSVTIFGPPFS